MDRLRTGQKSPAERWLEVWIKPSGRRQSRARSARINGLTEAMGGGSFTLQPSGFGYYGNHAIYYWPSVIVTTALL